MSILDNDEFREFIESDAKFFATMFGFYKTVGKEEWNSFKTTGPFEALNDKELRQTTSKWVAENKSHLISAAVYTIMEDWSGESLNNLLNESGLQDEVD